MGGYQMLWFGQGWLVFELTESPLYLGYVGLANASSVIALNLFGGVFADKLDKRRLIIVTRLTIAILILALAALTLFEMVEIWHIMLIAFVTGAVDAFGQPAHDALYPHLIPRKTIVSAVALDEAAWQGTGIVAPALTGLVISLTGNATVFFISCAGFVVMALVVLSLDVPKIPTSSGANPMRDMAEGLKFIGGNPLFRFLIATLFFNSFFGMSYWQMMPAFSVEILEIGADGQGVLMSLGGVGALAAIMVLGSMSGSSYRGPMIVGGGLAFGLSITAFALTSQYLGSYSLALVLMFIMGATSSIYVVAIIGSLQQLVPTNIRGRVMGFTSVTWYIGPIGGFQTGAIAELVGVSAAVAIGGMLVALFALGPTILNRQVRNLDVILQERRLEHDR